LKTIEGPNGLSLSAGISLNKNNSRVHSNNSRVSLKKNLATILKSKRDENNITTDSNS